MMLANRLHVYHYFMFWAVVLGSATVLWGFLPEYCQQLWQGYFISNWVVIVIFNSYEVRRLVKYFKTHHDREWHKVAHISKKGKVHVLESLIFIYSKGDFGDTSLRIHKQNVKWGIIAGILWIAHYFFMILLRVKGRV